MRQILQNLGSGETVLGEIPRPGPVTGGYLIATRRSLVSLGTERMLIDFGKAGWLEKARKQPDKVRQVIQKIRVDGLFPTLDAVRSKLDQAIPLGYCNAGVVMEARQGGQIGQMWKVGDRVVSNGPHAEYVSVPHQLTARIPEGVGFEQAAFTVVGSVGLQGIRLLAPTLGELVVVTGLGLIGLLSVQMLRANGCRVLGIDFDPAKCALARSFGAETVDLAKGEEPVSVAMAWSGGRGVDGVLVTASTSSSEPISQAARMCRKRGRIVLVGVTGLELSRAEFYEKELSFQVSCSYGPGRYDDGYEKGGLDYPIGFVRWTEQRNFEAFLDLLAGRRIDVDPLISHRFGFGQALEAYQLVGAGKGLGIVLEYAGDQPVGGGRVVDLPAEAPKPVSIPEVVVGVIGAGNFSGQVLLPALAATGARLRTVVSNGGVTGTHWGRKFGFERSGTEAREIFEDPSITLVVVTTRHDSHARYVVDAMRAGKAVYVEKPLCLRVEELELIREARGLSGGSFLMVGFNRRFAPHVVRMRELLAARREPKAFVYVVNAGAIPANHWVHDGEAGGGRILGEACHFVDLLRNLAGCRVAAADIAYAEGAGAGTRDIASIQLRFEDGSIGTVQYLANGSKSFPKERLEVFCGGGILQLDNFRTLRGFDWPGYRSRGSWGQDKGHASEMQAVVRALKEGGPSPIGWDELEEITQVCLSLGAGESYRWDGVRG
jgi:predicted dehydrogenase/threonine dehydrogenase-like Zn-dependent dehydrogenase